MSDLANNNLEDLLSQYEAGAENPEGDPTPWLRARSALQEQRAALSDAQDKRLESADRNLVQNAADVEVPASTAGEHPRSEWWWYLDVLATAGPAPAAAAPSPRAQLASRIFTGIEVAVLLVAIFLLLRNFGVQPFAPGPAPTSTPFPTDTPAPTATINAAAFDIKTAKPFKAPNDVLVISIPDGWKLPDPTSTSADYTYDFQYGDATSPSIFLEVQLADETTLYARFDSTGKAKTPADALLAVKASNSSGAQSGGPTFGDVAAAKLGKLDGQGVPVSIPANAQSGQGPVEAELRLAQAGPGKLLYVFYQINKADVERSKPIVGQILDTLVVNAGNIPTATATATLHPLLMTATAVETQIIGLTPTATATYTPTITLTPSVTPTAGPGTPVGQTTLTSLGLKIDEIQIGTGAVADNGKTVQVKYTGKLTDGTVFDSTGTGNPFEFTLGAGSVIKGWDQGILGMKVGGKRTLTIPPSLGYGSQAQAKIPANSTLIFDVELVGVK